MSPSDSRTASATAILLAAGRSRRMAADAAGESPGALAKPFIVLEGRTVLEIVCDAFHQAQRVRDIVLVTRAKDIARVRALARSSPSLGKVRAVVAGGEIRPESVRAGVEAAPEDAELFAIHDVARPLIESAVIDTVIGVAAARGAAIVAVPMTDTVKTSADGRLAESTLERSVLWQAQTPQVFRASAFRELLARAAEEDFRSTDDAALYERYVGPVPMIEGDRYNIKLTTPADVLVAAAILRAKKAEERPPR